VKVNLERAGSADDPQALTWGGLSWSRWHDFDQARDDRLIPDTPGIYRFRAAGEPGLLYIGESGAAGGRWARLGDLARGRKRHPADYYLNGGPPASPTGLTAGTMPPRTSGYARTQAAALRSPGRSKNTRITASAALPKNI
jgi:hypothetical protein